LTTSKDSAVLAGSDKPASNLTLIYLLAGLLAGLRKLFASPAAFPVLAVLLFLDHFLPPAWQGVLLLCGLLGVTGVCGEEYADWLRQKGLHIPMFLGLNAALIPVLIMSCWRPPYSSPKFAGLALPAGVHNDIGLALLTIITLGTVLCTLMVALALVAEVTEKLLAGLGVFLLACGGALVIGFALGHLLLLQQLLYGDPLYPLIALAVGWLTAFFARIWLAKSSRPLLARFAGLGLASLVFFWLSYPRIF
jgi:hypothetical protein